MKEHSWTVFTYSRLPNVMRFLENFLNFPTLVQSKSTTCKSHIIDANCNLRIPTVKPRGTLLVLTTMRSQYIYARLQSRDLQTFRSDHPSSRELQV